MKPGKRFCIPGYFLRQKLQRDEAMKAGIFSLINDAHPSAADFFENPIVRDGLTDHSGSSVSGGFILRTRQMPVKLLSQGGTTAATRLPSGSRESRIFLESEISSPRRRRI